MPCSRSLFGLLFSGLIVVAVYAFGASRPALAGPPPTATPVVPTATPTSFAWPRYGLDLVLNGDAEPVSSTVAVGATYARVYISWRETEPRNTTPSNYVWLNADAKILPSASAGLGVVAVISDCPEWACPSADGPLTRVPTAEFTQFAGTLADRYRGQVQVWEFWNEPDATSGSDGSLGWGRHGALYADMLIAAVAAMRQQDPQARFINGGLAYDRFTSDTPPGPFNHDFLPDVLARLTARDASDLFDRIAFHYYARNTHWPSVSAKTAELRRLEQSSGYNLPLALNETGLTSSSDPDFGTAQWGPSSQEIQARYLAQVFAQTLAARDYVLKDMNGLFWHTIQDYVPEDPRFAAFADSGLTTIAATPKSAFYAYRAFGQEVGVSDYVRRITAPELGGSTDLEAYLFAGATHPLWVLWNNSASPVEISFPTNSVLRVLDMCGQQLPVASDARLCAQTEPPAYTSSGELKTVTVTRNPVYVEFGCLERFTDVPCDFFAYTDIEYLVAHGAISGYGDGTFRPFNDTTRATLTKVVTLAEGWPIDTSNGPHFHDVPADNTFYSFIETAYHHGIINGYDRVEDCGDLGVPCFRWEKGVTRGQISKVIVRAADWPIDISGGPHFKDVLPDNPFYSFVETIAKRGIISGYDDRTFRWYNNVTRAQLAIITHRAITARGSAQK